MAQPRILVIGKNGQVGWELCRTLAPMGEVTAVDFPEIDLSNPDSLRQHVANCRPNIIVNSAAYTAVDKSESESDLAMKVNGVAPGVLAEAAKKSGALLVHYSTDYVFDGSKNSPYGESDTPNPLGAYGRSKLAGDVAIQQVGGNHLIFRLCWVYGARGQNFLLTMMRLARERETLRVVKDQVGCPTWSRMIAQATTLALSKVLASGDLGTLTGLYHLASSGVTSWHGFAERIVALMPPDGRKCTTVEPITSAEYPTPAKRPAYSVMDCGKLEKSFQIRLPAWEHSLRQTLDCK